MSEQIEKRPLDLLLVVEAAVAEVILLAEAKNIAISFETTGALPHVFGDSDKLKQALLNVLDNSIKYSRPGDQIQVLLAAETDGVRVTVSDTGPGIPVEHLPRITERFYRIDGKGMGKGLGLAIVAEILRLHDTQLEIKNVNEGDETGVSISFLLPA
jgi:signal transduction histidine kinase